MLRRLNDLSHRLLNTIQHIVGNPLWVIGNTFFFLVWMALQLLLKHPIDPPALFYPGTVWLMTVLGYIIELAMKAQNQLIFEIQQQQAEAQKAQMDRIEELLQVVRQLATDGVQKDQLIYDIVRIIENTVDKLAEVAGGEMK